MTTSGFHYFDFEFNFVNYLNVYQCVRQPQVQLRELPHRDLIVEINFVNYYEFKTSCTKPCTTHYVLLREQQECLPSVIPKKQKRTCKCSCTCTKKIELKPVKTRPRLQKSKLKLE